jgi:predicted MPP superfamily phosphohydrolase
MMVSRRAFLRALAASGAAAAAGAGAYGFEYGRHALATTRAALAVHGLAPALGGLRIGLITDVHRSRWVSADDVALAVDRLMAERPDLIVLAGDYVTDHDRRYMHPAADALRPLAAPHGVFGILGNHDDDQEMPAALARNGVVMLKDARTRIVVRREPIDLVGIRYWTKKMSEIGALVRGAGPNTILLAHDPRRMQQAAALRIPLVLSGHTHGGQVVLPVVGAIAAAKFPVVAGIGTQAATTMFVSRGVGTVYVPVRINCPPEVAVLTLQPQAA